LEVCGAAIFSVETPPWTLVLYEFNVVISFDMRLNWTSLDLSRRYQSSKGGIFSDNL